jgi:hypothetical protein
MIESTVKSTGLIPLCVRKRTIDIKAGALKSASRLSGLFIGAPIQETSVGHLP